MVVTMRQHEAPSADQTWALGVSAHTVVLLAGLVYFKTAKLIGVATKAKVPVGTGLLAYAQDVALCLLWLALLVGLGRLVARRRPLRLAAFAGIGLAETATLFYAMFNVHYFTLFGIPLNLEAMSDVEHVGEFGSIVSTYLASWHTAAALGFSALAALSPWLVTRPRVGRLVKVVAGPLARLAAGWRAPILAGSGLSAIVLVPIDQFELAKNDLVEMVQSAARVGFEEDVEGEVFDEGTNHPPLSFHEPDATIVPTQELRDIRQKVRWANKGKPMNVVFIVLESMVSPDVAKQLGIDEALPYTRKLAKRSIVFEDYSTVFPLSMKSLITLTCSILPSPERLTLTKINPQLDCRSVMEVATEQGYRAGLFHSGRFSFTLKNLYFEDRGLDAMIDANDLEQARPELVSDYWGIQEEGTIDAMFDWIDQREDQPFLAVYIPVVGHFPYVPLNPEFEGRYGTETKVDKYKNAMAYTDAMVKKTIAGFRERKLINDTVFVIVGDHGLPLELHPNNNTQSAEAYEENVQTLGYIYQPKYIKQRINYEEIVQHFDVLPSLYDMLGWDIPERYAGDSIFSTRPKKMAIHYTIRSKELAALRDGDVKVILDRRTRQTRAYDLASDPGETEDISSQHEEFADYTVEFFDTFLPAHARYIAEYPTKGNLEELTLLHERIDAADPPTLPRDEAIAKAIAAMQSDTKAGYRRAEKLLLSAAKNDREDFEVLLALVRVYDRGALLTERGAYGGSWTETVVAGGNEDEVLSRKLRAALRATFGDEESQRRLDSTLSWRNTRGPNAKPPMVVRGLERAYAINPDDPEVWALAANLLDRNKPRKLLVETDFPIEDVIEKLHAYVSENRDDWFVGRQLFGLYAGFLRDPDTAFELYSPEDALASGSPTMMGDVARACYDHGRIAESLQLYEAATKRARRTRFEAPLGSYYSHAGAAAVLLGDYATGRKYFNAAYEHDPNQTLASAGLAILAAWERDEGELVDWLARARKRKSYARKWVWTAEAELAALWRLKNKMRLHYLKAGTGDLVIDESRYRTAMHLEDWLMAERAIRFLIRLHPYEQVRFERYAEMAKELAKVHKHMRLPTTAEELYKEQRFYHAERKAWRMVDRANKCKMPRRMERLAEAYTERFPAGVHRGVIKRLLDPNLPDQPKRATRDDDEPDEDEDEDEGEGEDEEHDDGG
jgi:phosphoglycerol transferase MdoB-like AlkP superfamily enzyme